MLEIRFRGSIKSATHGRTKPLIIYKQKKTTRYPTLAHFWSASQRLREENNLLEIKLIKNGAQIHY